MTTKLQVEPIGIGAGFFQPTSYFLAAGQGDASEKLVAFDRALLKAGVGDVNLIKLSSIVGPLCCRIEPVALKPGSLVAVAYASFTSNQPGQRIASAVAIAHPTDHSRAALVMEYSALASKDEAEQKVIAMAIEGMSSRGLGVESIESIAVEHVVEVAGATFAAVVEL